MRTGLDRNTGAVLTGWDECVQSIGVVVTSAIGSLPLARDFGSVGPGLQDAPQADPAIMDHFMAIAEALRLWEPGFKLRKVGVTQLGPDGAAGFEITGDFYPRGHLGDFSQVENGKRTIVELAGLA
jgi:phage baseplate assembly protein W